MLSKEKLDYMRAFYRKQRAERVAAGLCGCGQPRTDKRKTCDPCRLKNNARCRRTNKNPSKKAASRRWREKNREKQNALGRAWRLKNPERQVANQNKWRARQKDNPGWIMERRLRARLNKKLYRVGARKIKAGRTLVLLGCSRAELVEYIERQFVSGMSWDNRGEWHIDHIRPCGAFDLTDPAQQKECFHFTNLRPRWALENQQAGAAFRWDKYRQSIGEDNHAEKQGD